ncbi:hypothetical protein DTL42_08885 [Bremerella cremea]|uniref:Uncharacterized protein n=1 Tax=Bremerella cremea TaxID=1031537 RepID=A0A368KVJ5_9BACT|nr:hypothetical protein [Bremerella cremea]RCS52924.1 hypothetical protein DTL42_08885 [Bremerella cremea]
MDESRSDQPLRFGLKDLMLATGVFGYFCGLVSLGVSGLGRRVLDYLAQGIGSLGPEIIAVWPFAFFGSLAMLCMVDFTDNPARRPKLFLLLNLAVVLAACCFPLNVLILGWNISFLPLTSSFALGAFPLSIAWLVHRWALGMPQTPDVTWTFCLLMFLDLAAAGSGIGLCAFLDF